MQQPLFLQYLLCQQRHDICGNQAACRANDVAHQSHQNANRHQSAAVGTSQNGSGCGTADVCQRCNTAGEHIQMEDLCQQHQNDAVDGQDHKARQDPCGCIGQLQEACAGGKQCHHGVQQQVGQLGAACHAAHGVTAPIRPDSVMSRTVQVALSRKGIALFRAAPIS